MAFARIPLRAHWFADSGEVYETPLGGHIAGLRNRRGDNDPHIELMFIELMFTDAVDSVHGGRQPGKVQTAPPG